MQGWGIDLSLFQFHGQLTWAVFFLHPDRTIYGRYGSRAPSGTSGFRGNDRFVTMERRLLAIATLGGALAVVFGLALLVWWIGHAPDYMRQATQFTPQHARGDTHVFDAHH